MLLVLVAWEKGWGWRLRQGWLRLFAARTVLLGCCGQRNLTKQFLCHQKSEPQQRRLQEGSW